MEDEQKVVGIFDRKPVEATVAEHNSAECTKAIVKVLGDILEQAKEGKYNGFCMVAEDDQENMHFLMVGNIYEKPFQYLGAVSRLSFRLNDGLSADTIDGLDDED